MKEKNGKRTFKRLKAMFQFTKPVLPLYLLLLVLHSPWNFLMRSIGAFFAEDVVKAVQDGMMQDVYGAIISLSFMAAGMALLFMVVEILFNYVITRIIKYTASKILDRIMRMESKKLHQYHSGDLMTTNSQDVERAVFGILGSPIWFINHLVSMVLGGMIFYQNSKLIFWICLGLGILLTLQALLYVGPLRRNGTQRRKKYGEQTEMLTDLMRGATVVRSFNIKSAILDKYRAKLEEHRKLRFKGTQYNTLRIFLTCIRGAASTLVISVLGLWLVRQGTLELSQVVLLTTMQLAFLGPFSWILNPIFGAVEAMASVDKIMDILEQPDEASFFGKAKPVIGGDIAVQFNRMSYCYREDVPLFDNFSLSVERNRTVALVGSSGSGKTTLIRLVMQYYRHSGGEIMIYGRPVSEYSLEKLRNIIAYVPQEATLFDATVAENILYGRMDASREEVIQAAKRAFAHDFIEELSQGYDTRIGERGVQLSGGQRQRIAIARAILKDAPILLLDEATSALDSESETEVQKAVEQLMKGRTIIVVAHRLSTIENADLICVLEHGKIIEQGRHQELMEAEGAYARLYNVQTAV